MAEWLELRDDEGDWRTIRPKEVTRVTLHDSPTGETNKHYVGLSLAGNYPGTWVMVYHDRQRAEETYRIVRVAMGLDPLPEKD